MRSMIKGTLILAFILASGVWLNPGLREAFGLTVDDGHLIQRAYDDRISNIVVETDVLVTSVLPAIEQAPNQQVFLVELDSGLQLRVRHDLDAAPSVPVSPGETIRLRGEYAWSADGGVILGTHTDPDDSANGGWIEHQGKRYF